MSLNPHFSSAIRRAALFVAACAALLPAQELKVGIIGTDTSHAVAFPSIFHDAARKDHVSGVKVVAAFKGGSADIEESASRVDKYAEELISKHRVKIVNRIADLCPMVDAILLESVDGRTHLPQFREAVKCGKPVFIDKPLTASWSDALEIARLGREAKVPWFSSSALRYQEWVTALAGKATRGAVSWGPGPLEEHHTLDLGWYAVHPIEVLFTIMGPGCQKVSRISSPAGDVVTGYWKDGRVGTVRTLIPYGDYGAAVYQEKSTTQSPAKPPFSYAPMLKDVVQFFRTGNPPVPNDVTLEIFAFMEAANRSKAQNGALVAMPSWK